MIDLAEMTGIAVDPELATVTAQGGVRWAELNDATGAHGLAVTGGAVSTTGIAGLTLGGGLGWLMAKYGLAADNLQAVELVTAAREILHVDATTHPDLFWALRGGGGNFGVATAFTYRLHPVQTVTGGLIAHPLDAAPELLRFYRDAIADASEPDGVRRARARTGRLGRQARRPRRLPRRHARRGRTRAGSILFLWITPRGAGGPHALPADEHAARRRLPRRSAQLLALKLHARAARRAHRHRRRAIRQRAVDPQLDPVEHFHGAVTRIEATDTAVPHREPGWNLVLSSIWTDAAAIDANIDWTRQTFAALSPGLTQRRWLNYLGDDQADDAIRAAYGPNYERLREIKRRYDPDNVFHLNHNITP